MLQEFELSDEDLKALYKASQAVPYMVVTGDSIPRSPAQIAAAKWSEIGDKMGFYYLTAVPVPGKPDRFVMAEPKPKAVETEEKKDE